MKNWLAILAAFLLAGCSPAYALDLWVGGTNQFATVTDAAGYSLTNSGPHVIWVTPGQYTNFNATGFTGTIRSISGELTGYGSAADTVFNRTTNQPAIAIGLISIAGTVVMGLGFNGNGIYAQAAYPACGASGNIIAYSIVRCRFDRVFGARAINSIGALLYSCVVSRSRGSQELVGQASGVYNCLFEMCYAANLYGGIVYTEGRNCDVVGNTFVGCNVESASGIINRYSLTTTIRNNLVITDTNVAWRGTFTDGGGNISSTLAAASSGFFSPPIGWGTNATTGGDPRIVANSAAWASGVQTAAYYAVAASNAAYDVRGRPWRTTNGTSGCFAGSPHDYVQFQGVFIP